MSLVCLLLSTLIQHQANAQLDKYQALFITKFIGYINWTGKSSNLTIGVVGDSPVLQELESALKKRGKKNILKKISNVDAVSDYNVIFIPDGQVKLFDEIQQHTAGKPVILITETMELADQGSVITFYMENDKLRFIVNKTAAESRGLSISKELLGMAKVI
jgi:hypothetical protein